MRLLWAAFSIGSVGRGRRATCHAEPRARPQLLWSFPPSVSADLFPPPLLAVQTVEAQGNTPLSKLLAEFVDSGLDLLLFVRVLDLFGTFRFFSEQ